MLDHSFRNLNPHSFPSTPPPPSSTISTQAPPSPVPSSSESTASTSSASLGQEKRHRSLDTKLTKCVNCHFRRRTCVMPLDPYAFDCVACQMTRMKCLGRPPAGEKPNWLVTLNENKPEKTKFLRARDVFKSWVSKLERGNIKGFPVVEFDGIPILDSRQVIIQHDVVQDQSAFHDWERALGSSGCQAGAEDSQPRIEAVLIKKQSSQSSQDTITQETARLSSQRRNGRRGKGNVSVTRSNTAVVREQGGPSRMHTSPKESKYRHKKATGRIVSAFGLGASSYSAGGVDFGEGVRFEDITPTPSSGTWQPFQTVVATTEGRASSQRSFYQNTSQYGASDHISPNDSLSMVDRSPQYQIGRQSTSTPLTPSSSSSYNARSSVTPTNGPQGVPHSNTLHDDAPNPVGQQISMLSSQDRGYLPHNLNTYQWLETGTSPSTSNRTSYSNPLVKEDESSSIQFRQGRSPLELAVMYDQMDWSSAGSSGQLSSTPTSRNGEEHDGHFSLSPQSAFLPHNYDAQIQATLEVAGQASSSSSHYPHSAQASNFNHSLSGSQAPTTSNFLSRPYGRIRPHSSLALSSTLYNPPLPHPADARMEPQGVNMAHRLAGLYTPNGQQSLPYGDVAGLSASTHTLPHSHIPTNPSALQSAPGVLPQQTGNLILSDQSQSLDAAFYATDNRNIGVGGGWRPDPSVSSVDESISRLQRINNRAQRNQQTMDTIYGSQSTYIIQPGLALPTGFGSFTTEPNIMYGAPMQVDSHDFRCSQLGTNEYGGAMLVNQYPDSTLVPRNQQLLDLQSFTFASHSSAQVPSHTTNTSSTSTTNAQPPPPPPASDSVASVGAQPPTFDNSYIHPSSDSLPPVPSFNLSQAISTTIPHDIFNSPSKPKFLGVATSFSDRTQSERLVSEPLASNLGLSEHPSFSSQFAPASTPEISGVHAQSAFAAHDARSINLDQILTTEDPARASQMTETSYDPKTFQSVESTPQGSWGCSDLEVHHVAGQYGAQPWRDRTPTEQPRPTEMIENAGTSRTIEGGKSSLVAAQEPLASSSSASSSLFSTSSSELGLAAANAPFLPIQSGSGQSGLTQIGGSDPTDEHSPVRRNRGPTPDSDPLITNPNLDSYIAAPQSTNGGGGAVHLRRRTSVPSVIRGGPYEEEYCRKHNLSRECSQP